MLKHGQIESTIDILAMLQLLEITLTDTKTKPSLSSLRHGFCQFLYHFSYTCLPVK